MVHRDIIWSACVRSTTTLKLLAAEELQKLKLEMQVADDWRLLGLWRLPWCKNNPAWRSMDLCQATPLSWATGNDCLAWNSGQCSSWSHLGRNGWTEPLTYWGSSAAPFADPPMDCPDLSSNPKAVSFQPGRGWSVESVERFNVSWLYFLHLALGVSLTSWC